VGLGLGFRQGCHLVDGIDKTFHVFGIRFGDFEIIEGTNILKSVKIEQRFFQPFGQGQKIFYFFDKVPHGVVPGEKSPVGKNRHEVFFNAHGRHILYDLGGKNLGPFQAAQNGTVKAPTLIKK
jgi:hypothetical protein